MTHEQKPESAEFRTREEIETEMRRLLTHGVRGPNAAMQVVHRIFDEARAFGASEERSASRAEQRRKNAEGAVAWVDPRFLPSSDYPWTDARLQLEDGARGAIPLYTRPANVAALEARVKELEGEVERRIAEAVTAERERCAQIIENHYEVTYEIGGNGLMPRKRGYISGLSYAAAIREGGEHG